MSRPSVPRPEYIIVFRVQRQNGALRKTSTKFDHWNGCGQRSEESAWWVLISAVSAMNTNGARNIAATTISPVILFAVEIGVIEGLQYFTQAYVAANVAGGSATYSAEQANKLGYPEDSTLFYPVLLYQQGFRYFNMGYASAMAMLLLAVSFAVTFLIVRHSRRFVHYQGAAR